MEIINTFVFPIIRTDMILPALESLRKNTPPNFKVIVVDQTAPFGGDYDFRMDLYNYSDLVIRTKLNYAFAQASNLGTRLATTPYVTISNDDIIFFSRQYWHGIMDTFEKFPTALGVVPSSPKEPGWGFGEPGYRTHATLDECLADPDGVAERLTVKGNGSVIDGAAMWCITFKRKEWMDLGMFDERFRQGGGEDYDSCARAAQAGYRILATSFSWAFHKWGQSKDEPTGFDVALPNAGPNWNKLSTKGFGDEGLWHPDLDVWGHGCTRTDATVWRAPL